MNVVEEYIRKLSSLPTTKYIAIREVNTRCPRNDITYGGVGLTMTYIRCNVSGYLA